MILSAQIRATVDPTVRRDAIRAAMAPLIDAGKLFLTPILLLDEPFRTNCLEVLDGTETDGDMRPIPEARDRVILPPVRLVSVVKSKGPEGDAFHFNKNGHIRRKRQVTKRVLGTDRMETKWEWQDLGCDVTVDARVARVLLARDGHPMTDSDRRGGSVVEVEWLRYEASRPDAQSYIKALIAEIDEATGTKPAPAQKNKGGAQAPL
jgi:hypothetical protein